MSEKLAKDIVTIVSIVIFGICLIINLFYISLVADSNENVVTNLTTGIELVTYLAIDFGIIVLLEKIEKKVKIPKKIKVILVVIAVTFYALISLCWVKSSNIPPASDSECVNILAIAWVKRRCRRNKTK